MLLKAWKRSGVDATLVMVGTIADEMRDLMKSCLTEPWLEHHPFLDDLRPIYAACHFFLLPSIEEGSPLVTYLALGASMPSIVSPMGSGGIIRDQVEGVIIDPHDTDAFAEAITSMVTDKTRRLAMGSAAGIASARYTWKKVACRRTELIVSALNLRNRYHR